MKTLLLLVVLAAFPAVSSAVAGDAPESSSVAFAVASLRDESRLVSSLLRLANRLEQADGVTAVEVRLARRDVVVRFDPVATGVPSLVAAVESLGFRASSKSATPSLAAAPSVPTE